MLVRGPRDGLDGCLVLVEFQNGLVGLQGPHAELVVVAARGQLLLVEGPLQAADLLAVPMQLGHVRRLLPHVAVQDVVIPAARGQNISVPGHGAHTSMVPTHGPQLSALGGIPNLNLRGKAAVTLLPRVTFAAI